MKRVAIVGGGASGMMAAAAAAASGADVMLLEQKDRVGKKLLSTGNGRCNFTNVFQEPRCYHSDDPGFPWGIVRQFDAQRTVSFFLELGIYSKNRNGYLYPYSDQASAVLDVLCMELENRKVQVLTGTKCREVLPQERGFVLDTGQKNIHADAVVLACGSRAAPATGSDGSGYALARKLGHGVVPVLPALVQLRCKENFYKAIAGVRVHARVTLFADKAALAEDCGEVQLTNYGISGIPVFQVSRYASRALYEKRKVTAVLDFMPDLSKEEFLAFLKKRIGQRPQKTVDEFLVGLFHKKLTALWLRLCSLDRKKTAGQLSEKELEGLCSQVKHFETEVASANSFDHAQVCCGGVDTRQVDGRTLESLLVPGVYFAGELLDVDGLCGGYNLQWAWSSGAVAGREAAGAK